MKVLQILPKKKYINKIKKKYIKKKNIYYVSKRFLYKQHLHKQNQVETGKNQASKG